MPGPIAKRSTPAPPVAGTKQAERAQRREDKSDGVMANIRNVTGPGWRGKDFKFETRQFTDSAFVDYKASPTSARPLVPTDFAQELSDCYAIASYQAIAQAMPGLLDNAIKQNADGTYTVTFYTRVPILGKTKHTETVSGDLPQQRVRTTSTAEQGDAWKVPLIEKAYAQWHGSYTEMEWGDPGKAMKNITGRNSKLLIPNELSEKALFRKLSRQQDKQRPMTAGVLDFSTNNGKQTEKKLDPFTNMHVYSVVSVQEEAIDGKKTRTITLRDPRQPEKPITTSLARFQEVFNFMRINKARGDKFDANED